MTMYAKNVSGKHAKVIAVRTSNGGTVKSCKAGWVKNGDVFRKIFPTPAGAITLSFTYTSTSYTCAGQVTETTGQYTVAGLTVTLDLGNGTTATAITDANGKYSYTATGNTGDVLLVSTRLGGEVEITARYERSVSFTGVNTQYSFTGGMLADIKSIGTGNFTFQFYLSGLVTTNAAYVGVLTLCSADRTSGVFIQFGNSTTYANRLGYVFHPKVVTDYENVINYNKASFAGSEHLVELQRSGITTSIYIDGVKQPCWTGTVQSGASHTSLTSSAVAFNLSSLSTAVLNEGGVAAMSIRNFKVYPYAIYA